MDFLSWKMKRFWDKPMARHWMKVDGNIGRASSSGGWGVGPSRGQLTFPPEHAEVVTLIPRLRRKWRA
jgi:hypothetical protein